MKSNEIFNEYKQSDFYKKYEGTYYSDSILKEVFNIELKKHRINSKSYYEIYNKMIEVMNDFFNLYYNKSKFKDEYLGSKMLYSLYIDPDGASCIKIADTECSADGLISLRRIKDHLGFSQDIVEEYKKYRRYPIIHFPKELNGINMSRSSIFGDRIDHTLLDLKNYYKNKDYKMAFAYSLPQTSKWLDNLGTFENLVQSLNIYEIFTNKDYDIYDLEKGEDAILEKYNEKYSWEWSETYYNNLKKKIEKYEEKIED